MAKRKQLKLHYMRFCILLSRIAYSLYTYGPHRILFAWILYQHRCITVHIYLAILVYISFYWWTAVWCMAYCECNWLRPLLLYFWSMDIRVCFLADTGNFIISKQNSFEFANIFRQIFTREHLNILIWAPYRRKLATLIESTPQYSIWNILKYIRDYDSFPSVGSALDSIAKYHFILVMWMTTSSPFNFMEMDFMWLVFSIWTHTYAHTFSRPPK